MRIPRQPTPGSILHVISRFVDRSWFITDDVERDRYLHLLGRALRRSDWRCLAYAIMSNHVHLAMLAGVQSLESWAKRVHSPFAYWMNQRRGRIGPVFADRPAAFVMRPENEGRLIAYIHNNPVRAGVAGCANQSSWTSHRAYVGAAISPAWLHVDEGLARCGVDSAAFDAWVAADAVLDRAHDDAADLAGISRAAKVRGAVHVATPTVRPIDAPLVARHFARIRPDPRDVVNTVAQITGVPATAFASRRRNTELVEARQVAVHAGGLLGLSWSDVAAALGIGRQTASRLGGRVCTAPQRAFVEAVVQRVAVMMSSAQERGR